MTLGIDIGFVKLILAHAAAVHGLPVKVEPVDLERIALRRLGLVGKGNQRDRRPTQDELERPTASFLLAAAGRSRSSKGNVDDDVTAAGAVG
ncbi:hypothetical protein NKJ26_01230 [Mesorhizobium sp. M0152]|uniref:hypothetical protein n=1 Tax=unclassified Mesorhizobium TaxID=325217 RepID=UPI00333609BD